MATWLVLEDFAGNVPLLAGGSVSYLQAGTLIDDTVINVPAAMAGGLPATLYITATMATPLANFLAGPRGSQQVAPDGNLLALLVAAGAFTVQAGVVFTFRPGGPASGTVVFNDWNALYEAILPLRVAGVPFMINIDLSLVGGVFAIPAGAWNFGGNAILAGFLSNLGASQTLQVGPGVALSGIREITQILGLEGLGGTLAIAPDSLLVLQRGALVSSTTAPLITISAGVAGIALILGGGLRNNGVETVDVAAGASLLIIASTGNGQMTPQAISGPVGATLQISMDSPEALVTTKQSTFLGSLSYTVSYVPSVGATLGGEIPAGAGTYFLAINDTFGVLAGAADLVPWLVTEVVRRIALTGVRLSVPVGTGVGGDTCLVELLVDGAVVASDNVLVDVRTQVFIGVPNPPGAIMLGLAEVSVRVTHAGFLGNRPTLIAQPVYG